MRVPFLGVLGVVPLLGQSGRNTYDTFDIFSRADGLWVNVDGNRPTPDHLQPKADVLTRDQAQIVTRRNSFQVVVRDQVLG